MHERLRFPLSSEQCELLVAFEAATSLADLARAMHKDASVISRNLQGLAESGVLAKQGARWALTALGRQVNNWTRTVAESQHKIFDQQSKARFLDAKLPAVTASTALLLLGVQNGFADHLWGTRNNVHAEDNIERLLAAWRAARRPVYHVRHLSKEPASPLKPGTVGAEFRPFAAPVVGEAVLEKSVNSAFGAGPLEARLRADGHMSLVIVGFTTNHCVDATARAAGDLGFSVFVVADACVAFDRAGIDGRLVKADETHRVVMANLNQEFATVTDTESLIQGPTTY